MASPRKKRKMAASPNLTFPVKHPECVLYIIERKVQRLRLEHLRKIARRKGFLISDVFTDSVTHVVSELETKDEVLEIIKQTNTGGSRLRENVEVVSMEWFSSCMEEGYPVGVTAKHRLKVKVLPLATYQPSVRDSYQDAKYCCQRRTPVSHHNKKLTDALEILEKHADFLGGDHNASRALAFRKGSTALKALPRPVARLNEVDNLNDLKNGKHCKRVIQEILEEGFCTEIEDILSNQWFRTMKIFTGIFGCGSATGRKWYDMKLRTLEDVKQCATVNLTTEQRYGIEHYDDINTPVTRREADTIHRIVSDEVETLVPGATVTITGGFSRGKIAGHDVDLLISHPVEGREKPLLQLLLSSLKKKELLKYTSVQNSSYSESAVRQVRHNPMDHFERCFSIFRLPKHVEPDGNQCNPPRLAATMRETKPIDTDYVERSRCKPTANDSESNFSVETRSEPASRFDTCPPDDKPDVNRDWVARRVDFIIAPQSQYAYALVGWIGSRMFNRSIRDYANREMNMTLTSHGLFDKAKSVFLPAKSQQDIFQHLNLEYKEPHERNC